MLSPVLHSPCLKWAALAFCPCLWFLNVTKFWVLCPVLLHYFSGNHRSLLPSCNSNINAMQVSLYKDLWHCTVSSEWRPSMGWIQCVGTIGWPPPPPPPPTNPGLKKYIPHETTKTCTLGAQWESQATEKTLPAEDWLAAPLSEGDPSLSMRTKLRNYKK